MKKTKEMHADCFYLFEGKAAANSVFIENLREAKQFCIYANAFLKGYLKIHEYLITQDGWLMIVKLHAKNEIQKLSTSETECWRIISERMRLLLSTYVRVTNKWEGREGVKVKHSYTRYYFKTLKSAKLCIAEIRSQQHRLYQKKKKYRGLKTHREIPRKVGKGNMFLCSKWVRKWRNGKKEKRCKCGSWSDIIEFKELVVLKNINATLNHHIPNSTYNKLE